MKHWFIAVALVGGIGYFGLKHYEDGKSFSIDNILPPSFSVNDNAQDAKHHLAAITEKYQGEAVICKYGEHEVYRHYKPNGDMTAFQNCQRAMKESDKSFQDSYFCFPEVSCP